jgi:hypothetical protein
MEALFLVGCGVPFDVAFKLDEITRFAFCVIMNSQKTGRTFNWLTLKFEEEN